MLYVIKEYFEYMNKNICGIIICIYCSIYSGVYVYNVGTRFAIQYI